MLEMHKILGVLIFSPRLVISEISPEVREILKAINNDLHGCGWTIVELGFDPENQNWHFFVSGYYNGCAFPIIEEVVQRYTKDRVVKFMQGDKVKC